MQLKEKSLHSTVFCQCWSQLSPSYHSHFTNLTTSRWRSTESDKAQKVKARERTSRETRFLRGSKGLAGFGKASVWNWIWKGKWVELIYRFYDCRLWRCVFFAIFRIVRQRCPSQDRGRATWDSSTVQSVCAKSFQARGLWQLLQTGSSNEIFWNVFFSFPFSGETQFLHGPF